MKRIEKDFIGSLELPADALYGIHSVRARENFPKSEEKHDPYFLRAYLLVKKACILAARDTQLLSQEKSVWVIEAIDFLMQNPLILEKNVIVSVLQGGAGTSLNMNLNEIIANQALLLRQKKPGDYGLLHPNQDINIAQSTNDTYPTALRIALVYRIRELTEEVCRLQEILQKKEQEFAQIVKMGRTEFQDAVPMTLGAEFGAFAEAISRDRWRLYKAEERLRVVNLGGTAIGTSLNASRRYIFLALEHLRAISQVGVSKAENLVDATTNQDLLLEAFGFIKLLAVNLFKISQDLRYLASSPVNEVSLPKMQAGSSIMPGKVNPVMPEMMIQIAMDVLGADQTISQAVMNGNLQLNAFLPLIARLFLSTLERLTQGIKLFSERCVNGITANREQCYQNLSRSFGLLTALTPQLGYEKVSDLIRESIQQGKTLQDLLRESNLLSEQEIKAMARQKE